MNMLSHAHTCPLLSEAAPRLIEAALREAVLI